MLMTKEEMLRNPKTAIDVKSIFKVIGRRPRNGEYAGPHSDEYTKKAATSAEKYHQKVPCGPNHFVYPSGLIGKRGKMKH